MNASAARPQGRALPFIPRLRQGLSLHTFPQVSSAHWFLLYFREPMREWLTPGRFW
jgi:hypothetical protein